MCDECDPGHEIKPRESVRSYAQATKNYLEGLPTLTDRREFELAAMHNDLQAYQVLHEVMSDVVLVLENCISMYPLGPEKGPNEDDPKWTAHWSRMSVMRHLMKELNAIGKHQDISVDSVNYWRDAHGFRPAD